jgi:hypothetical protein
VLLFGLKVPVPPLQMAPVAMVMLPFKLIARCSSRPFRSHRHHRRCWCEGDHAAIRNRCAIVVAGRGQGQRQRARCEFRRGRRVGRVERGVVRREAAQSTAPDATALRWSRCHSRRSLNCSRRSSHPLPRSPWVLARSSTCMLIAHLVDTDRFRWWSR